MHNANSWKSYRQIATQTAPPGQLVLMLFDGVLHSLERALVGFSYSDPGKKNQAIHNNLHRAVDIIRLLSDSLNAEAGGKLAETLRNLYGYYEQRILESNFQKQRQGVDEVLGHMTGLRDAWSTMLLNQGQESPLQTTPDGLLEADVRVA